MTHVSRRAAQVLTAYRRRCDGEEVGSMDAGSGDEGHVVMTNHLATFVSLRCAPLLAARIFPNPKEITESMGAWHAVETCLRRRTGIRRDDPRVTVICVGDGCTPRTGALFARLTAWQVYSVDPRLKMDPQIKRLTCMRHRIEDVRIDSEGPAIVVAVHSHADLGVAISRVSAPVVHAVAIPCCVQQAAPGTVIRDGDDHGIISPARRVVVWEGAA